MVTTAVIAPADCKELATWQVMALSAVAVPLTGTLTDTTLVTYSLPGGTLGPNGRLRITCLWSINNSANTKLVKVKFGGTQIFSVGGSTQLSHQSLAFIYNRNAQNSQVTFQGIASPGAAVITMAIDTSIAQNLIFTAQLTNVADTATLEAYMIEALYKA